MLRVVRSADGAKAGKQEPDAAASIDLDAGEKPLPAVEFLP